MHKIMIVLLFALAAYAGDTITIKHKSYTTTFDTVKHYPVLVQWTVTKSSLQCSKRLERKDVFTPDPKLIKHTKLMFDYVGSGYDKGHNMSAYDNGCDSASLYECFFFSNMTPQTPRLNRGDWKELEEYTRKLALANDNVKVWCGSFGEAKKIGSLSIPTYCWKVLYTKKNKKYEAFLFKNDQSSPTTLDFHRVTCDSVYKLTGFKIK